MKFNKKYLMLLFAGILLTASLVFFVYTIKANSDDNEIGISYAEITGIKTGTGNFTNDGLDYSNTSNYHVTSGYTAGNDSNDGNAIVRSFDKVTYNFNLGIKKKEELTNTANLKSYSNRTISITVTISEEAAKYVVFEENGKPGSTSHVYEIKGVDEVNGSKIDTSISLYVLGAPNGTIIDPKFEINESTNTDNDYIVTLGNTGSKHNYLYDALNDTTYSTAANFYNYLPTVVSSNSSSNLKLSLVSGDSQRATVESKSGRYMNYVLALYADGDIKGQTMPTGDIVLTANYSQSGNEHLIVKPEYVRLYNEQRVGDILPVSVSSPYSSTSLENTSKYTRNPGSITASNIGNNSLTLTISNYGMSYSYPSSNANGSIIQDSKNYIGSYAITLFSPRSSSDGINDINVNFGIDNANVTLVNGSTTINGVSLSSINSGYVESDYNLETGLYELDGTKIGNNGEVPSKSKGSEIQYITTFNYSSSGSNEGLKEVIKIDPIAFRFMNYTPTKDIDIKLYCGNNECEGISEADFEYTFVTGEFKASNYSADNYSTLSARIKNEDSNNIQNGCSIVNNNLSNYSADQIMNLYGGPCIKENNMTTYNKIESAVTSDNEEIILTKLIVQTKDGVKLPDNVKVVIKTKLRIRNVNDTTKIYQVTALATSSDYDSKITYYSPRVSNAVNPEDVVTNPNNYVKAGFYYNSDTSLFGDSLKVLDFETKQRITVTNKDKAGRMKTNFNAIDNETINFKVTTNINDYVSTVGSDDAWYIKDLKINIYIPSSLTYIPNDAYVKPVNVVVDSSNNTLLEYVIPFAKPNQSIPDILFDTILASNLTGNGNEIEVYANVIGRNINDGDVEFLRGSDSLKIYGNGINNMILNVTNEGSTLIEKDTEFAYYINAYNNTDNVISDYKILNILPSTNDEKGSTFNGSYKVRLESNGLNGANVLCSTVDANSIIEDVNNEETTFTECGDIFGSEGKSVTAIKITNISVNPYSNMTPIKVIIMPDGNNYSDVYKTSIVGGSTTYMSIKSNSVRFEVISRKISGKVFIDVDEDGVQNGNDVGIEDIPVSLYKIVDDTIELVGNTTTNSKGVYTFDNLDKGFYKIRLNYDSSLYDLALRYGIENIDIDSDAYKLDEGLAEISNKHNPYTQEGIDLVSNNEVKNMDMGLVNRKPFNMSIKKYITKIDLSYNGITDSKVYNNQSKVLLSVRNSLKATAKVYYGFEIINNSQVAGYVTNIYENIPEGLLFDSEDPYNSGWVLVNGQLQNTTFQSQKLLPGESIYAQVALNMPSREEAGSFLNKVSLEIKAAEEEKEVIDSTIVDDSVYSVGEEISYAGLDWHVINVSTRGNDQILTLLVDDNNAYSGSIESGPYKWSKVSFIPMGQLNNVQSILEDNIICDDASGLVNGSYGGSLKAYGHCTSGQYVTSKVRLLTYEEYNSILDRNLSDVSWLYGNRDFYLQTAVNIPTQYNEYGVVTSDFSNYINFVSKDLTAVGITETSPANKSFRYVITINSKYILNY
jgi:hypothetical protein